MAGDGVADGIAAILFEIYGRGRVSPRLWTRLVRLARGDSATDARSAVEAARALRSELLAAEHGLRLLIALVDGVWDPSELSPTDRRELAAVVGVYDGELSCYYLDSDLVVVRQLLGECPAEVSIDETPEPRQVTLRRAGTPRTRGAGQAPVSTAPVQPASIAWWMSLAALESWMVGCPGVSPDPASGHVHEASLGQWLFAQVDLLESGDLLESRRSELLRLLSSMRWGSSGGGVGPVP